jgi:hypothetical protein
MSLDQTVRGAVAKIDSVTKSLQTTILLSRWISQTYDGTPSYGAPEPFQAVVEYKQEQRQSPTGQTRVSKAHITIISPIEPVGAAERSEPIDERDLVTLPNLTTGPILETSGLVDPVTGLPYMHEIWLGDRRGDF